MSLIEHIAFDTTEEMTEQEHKILDEYFDEAIEKFKLGNFADDLPFINKVQIFKLILRIMKLEVENSVLNQRIAVIQNVVTNIDDIKLTDIFQVEE